MKPFYAGILILGLACVQPVVSMESAFGQGSPNPRSTQDPSLSWIPSPERLREMTEGLEPLMNGYYVIEAYRQLRAERSAGRPRNVRGARIPAEDILARAREIAVNASRGTAAQAASTSTRGTRTTTTTPDCAPLTAAVNRAQNAYLHGGLDCARVLFSNNLRRDGISDENWRECRSRREAFGAASMAEAGCLARIVAGGEDSGQTNPPASPPQPQSQTQGTGAEQLGY